jgi:hypothetical protein
MVVRMGRNAFFFFFSCRISCFLEGNRRIDGTAKREQTEGCAILAVGLGRNAKAKCSNCSQTYGVKR